jgi:hypothetical protein
MIGPPLLLAHGSGIDELVVFTVPVVLVLCMQWLGKRRRRTAERDSPER